MEIAFQLEVKAVDEAGVFEGLASTYGNIDHVKDVVVRGAFDDSLASRGNEIPILWAHDQANPVGLGVLNDSAKGLIIRGTLDLDVQAGRDAHSRLKKRIVRGLSIGYNVPEGGAEYKDGTRRLKRIDLHEVSLVAVPCNDQARIISVKSMTGVRDFEKFLHGAGWSKTEAKTLAMKGWYGLHDDEAREEPEDDGTGAALAWIQQQKSAAIEQYRTKWGKIPERNWNWVTGQWSK